MNKKIWITTVFLIIVSILIIQNVNAASYFEQSFKDIEVIYAAKMSIRDSSGKSNEAIFGVVGLWLPSEIKTPNYFNSYESWKDTLLGSSSILEAEETKTFEQVYTEDILKEKYDYSVKQCQADPSKLGEICNHMGSVDDLKNYLRSTYENGSSTENQNKERRKNKILSYYNEEQLHLIYQQQKALFDEGKWVRDIKLYFEIDSKRMLSDFVRFDFYNDGKIKAIYAKFLEVNDWKENSKKVLPDSEVFLAFDKYGNIDVSTSKILIPPTDANSNALACNKPGEEFITPGGEKTTSNILYCKSHCFNLNNKPLLLEGQVEEYDFFNMFNEPLKEIEVLPSEVTNICSSESTKLFEKISYKPDCTYNEILNVIKSTGPFTIDVLKTNDIIHFGWNWEENDNFLWGEWNLANLAESTYSGCKYDDMKVLLKSEGIATIINSEPNMSSTTSLEDVTNGSIPLSEALNVPYSGTVINVSNPSNETETESLVKLGSITKNFLIEAAAFHDKTRNEWAQTVFYINFDNYKGRLLTINNHFYMANNLPNRLKYYHGTYFDFSKNENLIEVKIVFNEDGTIDTENSRISPVSEDSRKSLGVCFNGMFENTGKCQSYKITTITTTKILPEDSSPPNINDLFEATKGLVTKYCNSQFDDMPGIVKGVYICDNSVKLEREGMEYILLNQKGEFSTLCSGPESSSVCAALAKCTNDNLCS